MTQFIEQTLFAQNVESYLFTRVDKTRIVLSLSEEAKLMSVLNREIIEQEYDVVMFNDLSSLPDKQNIRVNLGRNGEVFLSLQKKTSDMLGNTTFVYKGDYKNYAIVTIKGSNAFVFFQLADEVFNMEPLGDRYYILTKVDAGKARRNVRFEDNNAISDSSPGMKIQSKAGGTSTPYISTSNSPIDALVAYTPAAASASGDITSLISQAIQQANATYSNSGVNISLNLAYATQVNYTESGSMVTDHNNFVGTNDGYMDEIHALRTQYGADLCVLITASGELAGYAGVIGATFSTAFCVARYDYAVNQISFAHEIGHLLGGRHQFTIDGEGTYNHGYYRDDPTPVNRWRTVMAIYDTKWGPTDTRIPYWSDPVAYYGGAALGDANSNNRLQLNMYAPTISTFNTHVAIGVISTNTTWSENTYLGGNVTVASGVTLTISPGITVTAQGNYKLRIEGKLVANGTSSTNRVTFTRSGGQWYGIELNASTASSLQYCEINNATMPIYASNTTNLAISSVTINASTTSWSDAAIALYSATNTSISNTVINGNSNLSTGSSNGVRFYGSSGILNASTIQNCGMGNGIVLQNASSPIIQYNVISGNHYHGIVVVDNFNGFPIIYHNTLTGNGSSGYVGIVFHNSAGEVRENTVTGSAGGIYRGLWLYQVGGF